MSFSRTILLGNVGGDPEIRRLTHGDDRVASFSIATSERYTDKATGEKKETTEWHRVVCFNQMLIPVIEQWVKKGTKVLVEGQNKTRKWEKDGVTHYTTEVVIGRFNGALSLEGAPKGVERDEHGYGQTRPVEQKKYYDDPRMAMGETQTKTAEKPPFDDDIPF